MKITAVIPYVAWIGFRNQLLVKVEADNGQYGWGESGLSGRELAVEGAVKHYREFLIGKDPRQIGGLWQEMYRSQYFEGGRILTAAISAIDIALYDLIAKTLEVPVYQLLGGAHRDRVECFASFPGDTPIEEYSALTRKLMDENWTSFRLNNVGPPGADYEGKEGSILNTRDSSAAISQAILACRETAGPTAMIGCDMHHRLTIAESATFLQRLPSGTLDYIEEPIRDESPEAYEALRKLTDVPFAIGEEFASKWQFKPYIERNILQFARVDVCNVGGLTESMKVAAMAESNYIDLLLHNPLGPICTAASVHLAAAIPNFSHLESRESPVEQLPTSDADVFTQRLQLVGNAYPVPTAPGLGVEVDESVLKKMSVKLWEPPRLWRSDGSYQNW
ncbi:MAG: mandelate racemase/muconate lactonizing enzyme family protein [Verrucomicrobia bacterium]|nr:mandelate racemase/muconate lactonizing enzyme family protein [Verrucomicrobiota bacterium]MDA1068266.1 mandelate racemase/muconate lactonizing enzyme family protein [Verrucomicrobiota bacterium]